MGRRHRVCRELMSTPPFSPLVHASLLHSPSASSTFPGFPPTPVSASKLISLLSHLPQLSPSRWSLHADPLPAIPLSPVPSESSSPLSHIPAVCPPTLDPSSSSGPMVPPAESHGCSGPQGGPHLSWDDLIDTSKVNRDTPSYCSQLPLWPLGLSQTPVWTVEIQDIGPNPTWAPQ